MTALPKLPSLDLKLPKLPGDRRRGGRVSIEDLNRMGVKALEDNPALKKGKAWWEHPLDWLDLPRNAVGNVIGELVGVNKGKLDKGALGLPKVYMSDVLKKLGVKNGVVRGVAGFIGDVAIDPLTYLSGGSGAFVKIGKGASVVTKAAVQTLEKSAARAAAGGGAKALGRYASLMRPGQVGRLAKLAAKNPERLGRVTTALAEGLKGRLVRGAAQKGVAGDIARTFFKKYGRKGLPLAHIPFTAKEFTVPLGRTGRFQKALASGSEDAIRAASHELANVQPGSGLLGGAENLVRKSAGLPPKAPKDTIAGKIGWFARKHVPGEIGDIEERVAAWHTRGQVRGQNAELRFIRDVEPKIAAAAKSLNVADDEVRKFVMTALEVPEEVAKGFRGAGPVARKTAEGMVRTFKSSDAGLKFFRKRIQYLDNVDVKDTIEYISKGLAKQADGETRAGIMKALREGYFPRIARSDARRAIVQRRIQQGLTPDQAEGFADEIVGGITDKTASARHRTLSYIEYTGKDGKTKQLWRFQSKKNFDKLSAAIDAENADGRIIDITTHEANRLAESGQFANLLGDWQGPLFVTDPATAGLNRIKRGQMALAHHQAVKDITGIYGRLEAAGLDARKVPKGWRVPHTRSGMFKGLGLDGSKVDAYLPDWLAKHVETAFSYFDDRKKAGTLLRVYDKVLSWWKAQALVGGTWPTVNFVSNKLLMLGPGGFNPRHTNVYPSVMKMLRIAGKNGADPDAMLSALRKTGVALGNGKRINGARLYQFLVDNRIVDQGFFHEVGEALQRGLTTESDGIVRTLMQRGPARQIAVAGGKAVDAAKSVLGWYFDINSRYIENADKVALFLSRLRSGDSMAAAATRVKEALFDYGRLSATERNTLMRLFPFWRWMRNNTWRQMRDIAERPAWLASLPKTQNALDNAFLEEQLPQELLPDWVRAAYGVQITGDEKGGGVIPLSTFTPFEEPLSIAQDPLEKLFGSLTPALKTLAELKFGQNFYGRGIGTEPGEMGYGEYATSLLRFPKEIGRWSKVASEGTDAIPKAVLGGRLQELDLVRQQANLARETTQQIVRIRSRLKGALERGDAEEQQRLAAQLRQTYELRTRMGLDAPQSIVGTLPGAEVTPIGQ